MEVSVPQVRDTDRPFKSKLRRFFGENTEVLKRLVAEMYARGLSDRDIEDALYGATGDRLLSKSSVSALSEVLWEEYEAFVERDLSCYDVLYLFADAIYESVRKRFGVKEVILVAWGVCSDGSKVLLHLALGNKEGRGCWVEFFEDMQNLGLTIPLLVTSDGCPGLIGAIEEVFPLSLRARCWYHRMQNLEAKVPPQIWPELKAEIQLIRDSANYEGGKERLEEFVETYGATYPSLVKCLREDVAILNHLRVPICHRKTVRTTNLVERSFVEEQRRTKVIPGFLTEKSALKLIFSVMIRAAKRWNRIPMNKLELSQLETLRRELGIERTVIMEKMDQEFAVRAG